MGATYGGKGTVPEERSAEALAFVGFAPADFDRKAAELSGLRRNA
jgi:hypothetical protein